MLWEVSGNDLPIHAYLRLGCPELLCGESSSSKFSYVGVDPSVLEVLQRSGTMMQSHSLGIESLLLYAR